MIEFEPNLQAVVESLGYRMRKKGRFGTKDVLSSSNEVVFSGRTQQIWDWLKKTKKIEE